MTVEFGAKCNNFRIDGISFIEKLSFNAFNERACESQGYRDGGFIRNAEKALRLEKSCSEDKVHREVDDLFRNPYGECCSVGGKRSGKAGESRLELAN